MATKAMTVGKAKRLSLDHTFASIVPESDSCTLAAAALTESSGDLCHRLSIPAGIRIGFCGFMRFRALRHRFLAAVGFVPLKTITTPDFVCRRAS